MVIVYTVIFGIQLYFNSNTDFQNCNVSHHNNNFDHVWSS